MPVDLNFLSTAAWSDKVQKDPKMEWDIAMLGIAFATEPIWDLRCLYQILIARLTANPWEDMLILTLISGSRRHRGKGKGCQELSRKPKKYY